VRASFEDGARHKAAKAVKVIGQRRQTCEQGCATGQPVDSKPGRTANAAQAQASQPALDASRCACSQHRRMPIAISRRHFLKQPSGSRL